MGATIVAAAAGALGALVLVALIALVRRRSRSRADLEEMLAAAHREVDDLRARLEAVSAELPRRAGTLPVEAATYVITDAGQVPVPVEDQVAVPDRLVLSATLGRPLVKVVALGYGLRRALSGENRNRIRYEMRQQVRVARKRRRAQVRDLQRQIRAEERAQEGLV